MFCAKESQSLKVKVDIIRRNWALQYWDSSAFWTHKDQNDSSSTYLFQHSCISVHMVAVACCPIAHFQVSSCSKFQKPSQTATEQGKAKLRMLEFKTTLRCIGMLFLKLWPCCFKIKYTYLTQLCLAQCGLIRLGILTNFPALSGEATKAGKKISPWLA